MLILIINIAFKFLVKPNYLCLFLSWRADGIRFLQRTLECRTHLFLLIRHYILEKPFIIFVVQGVQERATTSERSVLLLYYSMLAFWDCLRYFRLLRLFHRCCFFFFKVLQPFIFLYQLCLILASICTLLLSSLLNLFFHSAHLNYFFFLFLTCFLPVLTGILLSLKFSSQLFIFFPELSQLLWHTAIWLFFLLIWRSLCITSDGSRSLPFYSAGCSCVKLDLFWGSVNIDRQV